jgi:hypothetical protein
MMQSVETSAATCPVPDLVADELQLAGLAKIGERKDRGQNRLEAAERALLRQQSICRNSSYEDLCTWIMFGSGIVDECLEKLSRPLGLVVMDAPS